MAKFTTVCGNVALSATLALILGWDAAPSWSYGDSDAPPRVMIAAADSCRPLLNPRPAVATESVTIVALNDPVQAGRAAAIGMIFGVHSAIGPRQAMHSQPIATGTGNPTVTSVTAYRHCRNEQALQNLRDEAS